MNLKNFAFWILILFIFILGTYLIYYTRTESFECLQNPYIYSIKLLEKANNATVTCSCAIYKQGAPKVTLTREGFIIEMNKIIPFYEIPINKNISLSTNCFCCFYFSFPKSFSNRRN